MAGPDLDFLKSEHPIFTKQRQAWTREETRFFGADPALAELRIFDWETLQPTANVLPHQVGKTHYELRQKSAVYINFPDLFTRVLTGHLMRQAPTVDTGLDFGTLGDVARDRTSDAPSQAEMVWYNSDGVGNDGSQWNNFWADQMRKASATGHRWIYVDSSAEAPINRQEEMEGKRPFLVGLSPLVVTNWHYDQGRLAFIVIKVSERNPHLTQKGELEDNAPQIGYLLHVREGWDGFDPSGMTFSAGGWWKFDKDLEKTDEGTYDATDGEIPIFPLYYERAEESEITNTMSRSGTMELGQAAVAYMNLSSAADYDAWDAGQSVQFAVGIDQDGYNLALKMIEKGSKIVPLPTNKKTGANPTVVDGSTGAVLADVFDKRLDRKMQEVRELAALEASGSPESSGVSKERGFSDIKSPRLALMASELEQAQNTTIHFLEQRFSGGNQKPNGSVIWPREYDLAPLVDSIREIFELMTMADVTSQTLTKAAIVAAARQKGIITNDDELRAVEAEIADSVLTGETEGARVSAEDLAVRDILGGAASATAGEATAVQTAAGEPVLI